MQYGAVLVTQAMRPVVLTIGRSTYTSRPISTPQMLALQAARVSGSMTARLETLVRVLREAFPQRWWRWRFRDPVLRILALPDALRDKVIGALFQVPGSDLDRREDESPLEQMRRAQRMQVYGAAKADGPAPTLATALAVVRAAYGDAWYWNPARWPTSDGYAPFAVTWVEYMGLQTVEARRRLERVESVQIALAKDSTKARRTLVDMAYPSEMVS